MRIDLRKLTKLTADDLQAGVRGLVWALEDSESSNDETEQVEEILWMLETELLNRGILPDNVK